MEYLSTFKIGQRLLDSEGNEFVLRSIRINNDPLIDSSVTLKGAGGEKEFGSLDLKYYLPI